MISRSKLAPPLLLAALIGSFFGCATAKGSHPQDMSAESHEQEAAVHADKAKEHAARYDPNAPGRARSDVAPGWNEAEDTEFNATEVHNIQAETHRRHANEHLAAAAALRQAEDHACQHIAPETRSGCPLLGPVTATQNTRHGVRIWLREDTNIEQVLEHIRCHVAYANTHGREGMDHCPLYVRGVEVEQSGPHIIELKVKGRANVRELQDRIAHMAQ